MRQYIWVEDGAGLVVIARAADSKKVRANVKNDYKKLLHTGTVSPEVYDRVINLITGRGNLTESVSVDGNLKFETLTIFADGNVVTSES